MIFSAVSVLREEKRGGRKYKLMEAYNLISGIVYFKCFHVDLMT